MLHRAIELVGHVSGSGEAEFLEKEVAEGCWRPTPIEFPMWGLPARKAASTPVVHPKVENDLNPRKCYLGIA